MSDYKQMSDVDLANALALCSTIDPSYDKSQRGDLECEAISRLRSRGKVTPEAARDCLAQLCREGGFTKIEVGCTSAIVARDMGLEQQSCHGLKEIKARIAANRKQAARVPDESTTGHPRVRCWDHGNDDFYEGVFLRLTNSRRRFLVVVTEYEKEFIAAFENAQIIKDDS